MGYLSREVTYGENSIREFPNSQEIFCGEYDEPERLLERFDLCPYVFSIPLMRTFVDVHQPQFIPRVDGPGLAMSLYRCRFSKAMLLVQVHLSAEVKLPPKDMDAFQYLWRDSEALPKSRIPVFVRVIWPDNERMSGGGRVVERFNDMFQTEFSHDMPIDALLATFAAMTWGRQRQELLGVEGMRRRLSQLEATPPMSLPALYPSTASIPNPQYTRDELLGMHVQYLAHLMWSTRSAACFQVRRHPYGWAVPRRLLRLGIVAFSETL